jgi:type II secretory pathway predicted ATPase ExeA
LNVRSPNCRREPISNCRSTYDLAADREPRIPSFPERRERELRELVRKTKRPVALFIDEAHDLHNNTLVGLKRLMEVVIDAGGSLSIVLSGHPKLKNDLQRPTMEEIGYRTTVISFEGIAGQQGAIVNVGVRGQAAACSSAACTGSPSRKRTPSITWASRSEPSSRRQLRSAD